MQSNIDKDEKFEDGEFSSKRVTKGPPCDSNEKGEKVDRSYDRRYNNTTGSKQKHQGNHLGTVNDFFHASFSGLSNCWQIRFFGSLFEDIAADGKYQDGHKTNKNIRANQSGHMFGWDIVQSEIQK